MLPQDIDAIERFQQELEKYLSEYEVFLEGKLKDATIGKHATVIGAYIEYICGYYDVKGFEDIKMGMGGSKFIRYFNHHWDEAIQQVSVQNILYKFFVFIKDAYGIYNPELLKKLGGKIKILQ